MSTPIDEIKSRLSIEEVVSRYVPLKKAGRNLKGLCPFHNEKTPSFIVSPEKQLAYCFGCHRGGDVFKFTQEMEGVDFPEALRILAERAGVKLDSQKMDRKTLEQNKSKKTVLYQLHQEASRFFQKNLWETEAGKLVLKYLADRGFDQKITKEFELGLAPDSFDQTYQYLVKKGFSPAEIVQAGLAKSKDTESRKIYDHFRGRLMFPIWDEQGKTVAFGGRVLKRDVEPKYLNSPETLIYHKGKLLYNFNRAKKTVRQNDQVLVVEGYMDVMACHKIGSANVVASSGTALTSEQLGLIKRFTQNLTLSFDQDTAGREALDRAVELAQGSDFKIKVLTLPEGKDPDEFIKRQGKEWLKHLETAMSYLDYYFTRYQAAADLETEEGRRYFLENLLPILKRVASRVEKDRQIKKAALVLGVKAELVYDELAAVEKKKTWTAQATEPEEPTEKLSKYTLEEYLIGLLIQFPAFVEPVLKELDEKYFPGELTAVYKEVQNTYNKSADFSLENWLAKLEPVLGERLKVLSLWVETQNECLADNQIQEEVKQVAARLKAKYFDRQKKDLLLQMQKAKMEGRLKEEQKLFQKYCQISQKNG